MNNIGYNPANFAVVGASGELNSSAAFVARAVARFGVAEIFASVILLKVLVAAEFRHKLQVKRFVPDLRQKGGLTIARVDFSGDHRRLERIQI